MKVYSNGDRKAVTALTPTVPFEKCPIGTSLGVLGRKWTMLILRDIAFLEFNRFNQMVKTIPGLTPRVLSMRLKELERDGIIERGHDNGYPLHVEWQLTEKGKDVMPILMSFIGFGSKWYPERVFKDGRPRTVRELFPEAAQLAEPPTLRQTSRYTR